MRINLDDILSFGKDMLPFVLVEHGGIHHRVRAKANGQAVILPNIPTVCTSDENGITTGCVAIGTSKPLPIIVSYLDKQDKIQFKEDNTSFPVKEEKQIELHQPRRSRSPEPEPVDEEQDEEEHYQQLMNIDSINFNKFSVIFSNSKMSFTSKYSADSDDRETQKTYEARVQEAYDDWLSNKEIHLVERPTMGVDLIEPLSLNTSV